MSDLNLLRLTSNDHSTQGVMFLKGLLLFTTLEPPWKNNAEQISCIPPGHYKCKRRYSPMNHTEVFEVMNVKDRTDIEIHIGNFVRNTKGCILIGRGYDYDKDTKQPMIINSTLAFREFMRRNIGFDELTLKISNQA